MIHPHPENDQSVNLFEGLLSAASMDWDLRNQSNSARWTGQIGLSQIKSRDYCEDTPLDSQSDQSQLPSEVRDGLAARIEYGQLGKSFNWFTRVNMTQPGFATPSVDYQFIPDRIGVTAGFRHARIKGDGIVRKGQFSVAVSQWLQYSDLTPKETILTGQTAVLTPTYNMVSLTIYAGIRSSGDLRLEADLSVSSDIRRRLILTPRIGHTWMQNDLRISHGSMGIKGVLRDRLTLDLQIMATHTSGTIDALTSLVEFATSKPTFVTQRNDMNPLVQCHSLFEINAIQAISSNCIRVHTFVTVGLFRTLDFEVGMHALGIGIKDHLNQKAITDGRADLVGELRWEFKPRAVFRLGANLGRNLSTYDTDPSWEHVLDLLTAPINGRNYHLFSLSIARRWQR